jgi:hypothetical protein
MSLVSVLQMVFGTRTPFVPPSEATLPLGAEIREISPEDRESCLKIYRDNEPGRFPAGVGPDFEHFLSRSDYLKLVCCVADKPVAVGGIGIIPGAEVFACLACIRDGYSGTPWPGNRNCTTTRAAGGVTDPEQTRADTSIQCRRVRRVLRSLWIQT